MSNDSDNGAADDFQDVGAADALVEGALQGVDVGDERVLLACVGGRVHAVGGFCTHQIAHLEDGRLEGTVVRCPRHWAGFDLETGEPTCAPADMPLPVYDVRIRDGRLLVSRRPKP